ncbi:MAG: hypothetical protein Q7R64_03465 [bacterium]|nr:hypothetical protein [bacterium]
MEFQLLMRKETWTPIQLRWVLHYFLHRKLVRELIKKHGQEHGLDGIIFLSAHGKPASTYCYWHFGKVKKVQEWIDRHDGKATALVISSCNRFDRNVTSKHSIIIHPNRAYNLLELMRTKGYGIVRVRVPSVGYVEQKPYLLKKLGVP